MNIRKLVREEVRKILREALPQDFSMPRYASFEQPIPEPDVARGKFEKSMPDPEKEDAKISGGMTKTLQQIKNNEKTNRFNMGDIRTESIKLKSMISRQKKK